jgi:drug/metabolite transporter (DMT)-like permease
MGAVVRHWRWVLAFSVIEVALPFGLLGVAEQRISSSLAGLLVAAVPLLGALFAWLLKLDDGLDRARFAGLLVGIAGVAALVGIDVRGGDLWAVAAVGLVAAGYAIGPVIASLRLGMLPGMAVSAASVSVVAALYAVPAWITRPAAPSALPATAWIAVAVLGVVCTAVGLLLFFALVAEVGPARATVITYVNPAVAVVLGVALLAEPITVGILIGFPLVLLGSYLATRHSGVAAPGTEGAPPLRADGDDSGTSREEGSLSPTSPTSRAASSGTSS